MPRKLLFIVNEARFFLTHRVPVARAMRAQGFEVHVAAPFDRPAVADIEREGFIFHAIPLARGARNPVGELRLWFAIFSLIRRVRPDLLHLVSMKPVLWGGMVARLLGVPAVIFAITGLGFLFIREGFAARTQRAAVKRLYALALAHPNSSVIFQNPDDRQLFVGNRLVDEAQIVTIPGCGVDLNEFQMRPEPEGPPVVLFPARLIADKGVNEFVEAAQILHGDGVAARFVLAGRTDPDNPTDLGEPRLRRLLHDGVLEWIGYSTTMPATLAASNIVCLPSYREGLPRVLIEAAACGRAIVATDVPGCREIVRAGVNGLLAAPKDGRALAAAIRRLIDDCELRRAMGKAGRELAVAEFSVERFVELSLAAYRSLLPGGALGDAAIGRPA
jgi:glycosyltransferase involved in cell wall biosynthesis